MTGATWGLPPSPRLWLYLSCVVGLSLKHRRSVPLVLGITACSPNRWNVPLPCFVCSRAQNGPLLFTRTVSVRTISSGIMNGVMVSMVDMLSVCPMWCVQNLLVGEGAILVLVTLRLFVPSALTCPTTAFFLVGAISGREVPETKEKPD